MTHPSGTEFRRGERVTALILGGTSASAAWLAEAVIAAGLAASWLIAYAIGGAQVAAPHWFYLPIIFAAVRFGPGWTLLTSVVAGVLAGPLLPLGTNPYTAQPASDWISRTMFFVLVGQAFAWALRYSRQQWESEHHAVRLDRALRHALDDGELCLHYQPLLDLQHVPPRMVGAEALMRWHQPRRGLVGPAEFVPTAEHTGLIVPMTEWALHEACDQAAHWRAVCGGGHFEVTVNVSPVHLDGDDLPDHVGRALADTGLPPECLTLEITETTALRDLERTIALLEPLRTLGVRCALDDFGTGHASLAHLQRLPIRTVKIDGSFTARIPHDPDGNALIASLITLAHTQGLVVLAEGVETAAQAAALKAMGCDLAQGFHYGRPHPPQHITELLTNHRTRTELGSGSIQPVP